MGRPRTEEEISPNLIPMIDIMFLLLLFFMLGADMGQREIEEVRLPLAFAVDPPLEGQTLIVNVYHASQRPCAELDAGAVCGDAAHWRIGIRGRDHGPDTLLAALKEEADLERASTGPRESLRRVVVRADQAALYGVVQLVLSTCADERVKLVRLSIAAAQAGGG